MRIAAFVGILLAAVTAVGCVSGTTYLGQIGDTKFYALHTAYGNGPNLTALVTEKEGNAAVEAVTSGPGYLDGAVPALIGASGQVGTALVWKNALKRVGGSETNINNSPVVSSESDSESDSNSQAQSDSSSNSQSTSESDANSSSQSNSSSESNAQGGQGGRGGNGGQGSHHNHGNHGGHGQGGGNQGGGGGNGQGQGGGHGHNNP